MGLIAWKVFVLTGYLGFIPLVVGLAILLYIVSKDADNNSNIQNNLLLQKIIDTELQVLNSNLQSLADGAEFMLAEHPYSNDLDLFGPSSLFQLINRAQTFHGKQKIA